MSEPKPPPASVRVALEYLKSRKSVEAALEERQKAEEAAAEKLKVEQVDARRKYSREYRARVRKHERLQKFLAEVEERKKQEKVEEEKKSIQRPRLKIKMLDEKSECESTIIKDTKYKKRRNGKSLRPK